VTILLFAGIISRKKFFTVRKQQKAKAIWRTYENIVLI